MSKTGTRRKPAPLAPLLERTEADIQREICAFLAQMPGFYWRNNTGAVTAGDRFVRFGVPGMPDILGFVPPHGRGLAIEVKRKGEQPTPAQQAVHEILRRCGVMVVVAHGVDDVYNALQHMREERHENPEL